MNEGNRKHVGKKAPGRAWAQMRPMVELPLRISAAQPAGMRNAAIIGKTA